MANDFDGFPKDGLDFLQTLGTKDKVWFDANRRTYDEAVVTPTKAFVVEIGERLGNGFAPLIEAQPKANGSIAPINNDLRFSPDKSPYKDHLLLKFWEGPNKKLAPTLYVRISADDVGFGTGAMLADLERWREIIDDDKRGPALTTALTKLGTGRSLDVAGVGYKLVPKPYPEGHPRADLLRHKMFQARWAEPTPTSIHSADFVEFCMERLDACADVHRWFVANLAEL